MRDSQEAAKSGGDVIMIADELIENITKIANNEALVKELDPNLFQHEDIKPHQVKRVLYAYLLFEEEYKKYQKPLTKRTAKSLKT